MSHQRLFQRTYPPPPPAAGAPPLSSTTAAIRRCPSSPDNNRTVLPSKETKDGGLEGDSGGTTARSQRHHQRRRRHFYPPCSGGICRRDNKIAVFGSVFVMVAVLWSLIALAILASQIYSIRHTTDPCEMARRSLTLLGTFDDRDYDEDNNNNSGKNTGKSKRRRPQLPKIIHQQWKDDSILASSGSRDSGSPFARWHQSWLDLYPEPEYQHMLWTDAAAEELVRDHYPWILPTYERYSPHIKRVDAARYFILHRYGGLYADMDYEPLTNFWKYLPADRVGIVESPHQYGEYHQNSLMSSPKNHPFWNATFELLLERRDRPVLHATGPSFVDAVMDATASYTSETSAGTSSSSSPSSTPYHYTLPCENFHRIPAYSSSNDAAEAATISPWFTRLWNHQLLGRMYPMKYCGDFRKVDGDCQFGRHHNAVTWMPGGLWRSFRESVSN